MESQIGFNFTVNSEMKISKELLQQLYYKTVEENIHFEIRAVFIVKAKHIKKIQKMKHLNF